VTTEPGQQRPSGTAEWRAQPPDDAWARVAAEPPREQRTYLIVAGSVSVVAGLAAGLVPAVASVGMAVFIGIVLLCASLAIAVDALAAPGLGRKLLRLLAALLTFAAGLRSMLRSDPDVIMIGEVRDGETAQIMMQAALTGHMVLATIHTNDAASTLTRLTEMGVEPFLTASGVLGVLAQRLARRLCLECRRAVTVPADTLREFAGTATLPKGVGESAKIYQSVGCAACRQTGYKGRLGIYEVLMMSEEIERLTAASAPSSEIRRQARREGMRTMREDGVMKVLAGETTLNELSRTVA